MNFIMKRKHFILSILVGVLFYSFSSFSQQIQLVNPTMTPEQAVQDVLLGAGVVASNITINGGNATTVSNNVKQFNAGTSNFPIMDGVVLHTSDAPLVNNDPDLAAIGGNVTNGVVLEFDFIPDGNLLSFNYLFASSEYSSFTCSQYNDVFGFFISGPGISGPYTNGAVNLATIPGSNTPVGINTVNSGSASSFGSPSTCFAANPNWQSDSQYWTNTYNNAMSSLPLSGTSINGSTVVLPAEANLQCGETYHIKMAISNVSDQGLNSAVFLEANSFSAAGVNIDIQTNTTTSDTVLIAGCTEGTVLFTRPSFMADDSLTIHFQTGGTLDEGVHYPFLAGGADSVVFSEGQDTIALTIAPYPNNDGNDPHEIFISAYSVNQCGDTVITQGSIWVLNEPYHQVTSTDTLVLCHTDSIPLWANTTGDFDLGPYSYSWYNLNHGGDTIYGDGMIASAFENDTLLFLVTSTDQCGFEYVDTARIIMDQRLKIDSLVQIPADCGENNGAVIAYGNSANYTGTPHFTWSDSNNDTIPGNETNSTAWPDRSAGWYYFTVEDDVCQVMDSIMVEQNPPPTASFEANPTFGVSPLNVIFTNTSDPASEYYWDFGNGDDALVNDLSNQSSTYYLQGTYTVTLTAIEGGCTDVATAEINVVQKPSYDLPNGFSPNGDGVNDFFTINAENVVSLEVVILNRWGNVVFESTDINFLWNGRINNSGPACEDGTYFYKVKMIGYSGEEIEEHGFVHLFKE